MILGVDPGSSGCLVVLSDDFHYVAHLHMPLIKVGAKSRVNGAALAAWLRDTSVTHAYIELVGAMGGKGKQGASSMFSFGHSAGVVEGIIAALEIPITLVKPEVWKKRAGLIGQDKDASRTRAIQLYPKLRDLDLKAKGQALADSILIARHGHV